MYEFPEIAMLIKRVMALCIDLDVMAGVKPTPIFDIFIAYALISSCKFSLSKVVWFS